MINTYHIAFFGSLPQLMSMSNFCSRPHIISNYKNTAPTLPAPDGWDNRHPSHTGILPYCWLHIFLVIICNAAQLRAYVKSLC